MVFTMPIPVNAQLVMVMLIVMLLTACGPKPPGFGNAAAQAGLPCDLLSLHSQQASDQPVMPILVPVQQLWHSVHVP